MFKFKWLISIAIIITVGLAVQIKPVQAVNLWGDYFNRTVGQKGFDDIGLGRNDPRVIAANVINFAFGLLGVLAIMLIIYGGFIWMTAGGDVDKVTTAKNIIIRAAAGLLIILAGYALAIYIIQRLVAASGGSTNGVGFPCSPDGATLDCGCGGLRTCQAGQWGACIGSDCGGGSTGRKSCDANALTPECDADNTACTADSFCNLKDCLCSKKGAYNDPCDGDSSNASCEADNDLCQDLLTCDTASCRCLGEPVIEALSPVGGFCDGAPDTSCTADADCASLTPATCNQKQPNGAPGNLITISGRYFLPYSPGVSQVLFWDGSDFTIAAALAETANPSCSESWRDDQIVVVVPAGAVSGALKVVAASGADTTDNNRGPQFDNFIVNNLQRPGLCNLNPVSGQADDLVTYSGLSLNGVTAYFGSSAVNIKANNSDFTSNDKGTALVPNLQAGPVTSFTRASTGAASNALLFSVNDNSSAVPVIAAFEPASGPPGQYVTIRGSGFGSRQQNSQVYFGATAADFNFPAVCAQTIWRENEIVVKVPADLADGDYKLSVELGKYQAESQDSFKVDRKIVLAPGLCRLSPLFGQANENVTVWGEYFDSKDVYSRLNFRDNQERRSGQKICLGANSDGQSCQRDIDCDSNQCVEEIFYWDQEQDSRAKAKADMAVTRVPVSALTGPVRLGKQEPTIWSNSLNFTIGQCTADNQCGGNQVCCPAGTATAGRCQDNTAACYGSAATSVYEWEFDTGSGGQCPTDRPNLCQDGSCCRSACVLNSTSGQTTCLDNLTCAGYSGNQCLDTILCPNSPGNCSQNDQAVVTGTTCDCSLLGCPTCLYDEALNRCATVGTCSLKTKFKDGDRNLEKYCALDKDGQARWQVKTKQDCPTGYTMQTTGSGICIDLQSSCEPCATGLVCSDVNGGPRCVMPQQTCPTNFSCQDNVCQRSGGLCECCCDKTKNNADGTNAACCSPLTCNNECGAGGDFGYCSGCADIGTTQAEHDAACNCTGHSGKYCDTSLPGGACRDCGQIGSPSNCSQHAACCVDFKNGNACTGLLSTIVAESGYNYCGYFGCEDDCLAPSKEAAYPNEAACQENCADDDGGDIPAEKSCATPAGTCSLLCGNPYTCRGDQGCEGPGCSGQADEDTCLCCCNPNKQGADPEASDFDTCKAVNKKLACQADMGDCTGQQRGLCCGCKSDDDCGDPANVGCGQDTCCHNRAEVEATWPANNDQAVCRNAMIRAQFNQAMDEGSFGGNVLVVGDYGDALCPADSILLATNQQTATATNFLVRLWQTLKNFLSAIVSPGARAADNHNFCAFTGQTAAVTSYDGSTAKTAVDFLLNKALTPDTDYYVILKNQAGAGGGIIDANRIAFKGLNNTAQESFNGLTYPEAYIWTFRTGSDICFLDKVEITPPQHLFQKANDNYPFFADAKAANGQIINSLSGLYAWQWSWRSDNSAVAKVAVLSDTPYQAMVSSGSKSDAETFIYARATITEDAVSPVPTVNQYKEGRARIIVFICDNPWPVVTDPNQWPIRWRDEADNCTICTDPLTQKPRPCQPGDCLDNNFAFYYCRDNGSAGSRDDLPSLANDSPIRGRYKYLNNQKSVEVLKDFYFFRSAWPAVPASLQAVLTEAPRGGEVKLTWPTKADETYKIYYGDKSGSYTQVKEAGQADNILIAGLSNNKTYYFAVTATDKNAVESAYSPEVSLLVEDKIAPAKPSGAEATVVISKNNNGIDLVWPKILNDSLKYVISYGPNPSPALKVEAGAVNKYSLKQLNNLPVADYYLELKAVDGYNNTSESVKFFCAKGCLATCACVPL